MVDCLMLPAFILSVAFAQAAPTAEESVDFTWLFLKTILAMVVVIGLAVFILKFVLPKLALKRGLKSTAQIQVTDRIPLDHRKGLFVVKAEGRRFLLGASEHYVGLVAELGEEP